MRPEIMRPDWYPPAIGRFRFGQIAQRSTWARVPDAQTAVAGMHVVHVTPHNGTTITYLQPLDIGTGAERDGLGGDQLDELGGGWLAPPPVAAGRVGRPLRGY